MKNLVRILLFTALSAPTAIAQDYSRFLIPIAQEQQLSERDINSHIVSSNYSREETQMQHVYLQQTVHGIPIFNALLQVHIQNGDKLIFYSSRFISDALSKIDGTQKQLSVDQAFSKVSHELQLGVLPCPAFDMTKPEVFSFNCKDHFNHPVRAKTIFFPDGEQLKLAFEFALEPKKSNAYTVVISATDGSVLWKQNRTISCQFDHSAENTTCNHLHHENDEIHETRNLGEAVYNAYPMLIESPIHGPRAMLNAEELPLASPFGWHDTNGSPGAEHTITRGNNVYAHEDIADMNEPGYAPDGGPNLNFDFPFFEGQDPLLSLDASITNLFVWNNYLHDISFFYGFDEVSGNFQETNYSGQAEGNDFVFAHAFDGSGTNNANFGTPEEGLNPYMQMYIWEHIVGSLLEITEPTVIADSYTTGAATFGVNPPTTPFNAEVVLVNDGSGAPTMGCGTLINAAELSGKIAYFDRGSCTFAQKVINAQNAGALAVIIANNQQGGAMSMGGSGNTSIPVVSISQNDGVIIKEQLSNGVTVMANFGGEYDLITHDSSFDNGIIAHEYGHGISNRLTGGSFQVNCLWNDEQMGEGWSDFFALIVSDTLGATGAMPRGIGNFASNRPADAFGIRPFPYTTDMTINPLTYGNINGLSVPHGVGSAWATMIWDLYWALVDEYGHSNNMYSNSGGNNIAIRLVMEGMRLQACNPGFVDGRDAILAADNVLYNGDNQCLIWKVFARRGLGNNADQGSSMSVGDEFEAFDLPDFCAPGANLNPNIEVDFVVYPNPASDQITIKTHKHQVIRLIRVTDVSGNLIQQVALNSDAHTLEVAYLARGLYFVEIHSDQKIHRLPWLKL